MRWTMALAFAWGFSILISLLARERWPLIYGAALTGIAYLIAFIEFFVKECDQERGETFVTRSDQECDEGSIYRLSEGGGTLKSQEFVQGSLLIIYQYDAGKYHCIIVAPNGGAAVLVKGCIMNELSDGENGVLDCAVQPDKELKLSASRLRNGLFVENKRYDAGSLIIEIKEKVETGEEIKNCFIIYGNGGVNIEPVDKESTNFSDIENNLKSGGISISTLFNYIGKLEEVQPDNSVDNADTMELLQMETAL